MHFMFYRVTYQKVQLLQAFKPEDKPRQKEFAMTMLDRLDSDPGFLKQVNVPRFWIIKQTQFENMGLGESA